MEWGAKYEVYWDNIMLFLREAYVVILAEQTCSCGKWDKIGIPCQHAMAGITFQGEDPINYVAHWFSKDTYSKAYQFVINPVKGRTFWPTNKEGPMLPSLVKRMPGRPAKKKEERAFGS